jgi:hypothetical protein
MDAIHEEEYKGYTIKIERDDNLESPREWDNAGKMVCWHRNYNLGDEQPRLDPEEWIINFARSNCKVSDSIYNEEKELTEAEAWEIINKEYIFLPLWLYDHSGITISTSHTYPYDDRWDAGQVGWIYISHKDAVKEWGKKLFTKIVEQKVVKYLQGEVETYDDYLTGNVYGYIVENKDGEHVDSCWGFYPGHDGKSDYEYCLSEARSHADWEVEQAEQKKYESARVPMAEIAFAE